MGMVSSFAGALHGRLHGAVAGLRAAAFAQQSFPTSSYTAKPRPATPTIVSAKIRRVR